MTSTKTRKKIRWKDKWTNPKYKWSKDGDIVTYSGTIKWDSPFRSKIKR